MWISCFTLSMEDNTITCPSQAEQMDVWTYIVESMTKYQQLALEKYNNAVVFIIVPTCYPLTKPELNRFNEAIRLHLGYDDILFGTSTYESSRQDVKVTLLLNRL